MNSRLLCFIVPFIFFNYAVAQLAERTPAQIYFSLFEQEVVTYGQSLKIEGVVDRNLIDQTIMITLVRPSGHFDNFEIEAGVDGQFSLGKQYQMDAVGMWLIRLEIRNKENLRLLQRESSILVKKGQAHVLNLSQSVTKLGQDVTLRGYLQAGISEPRLINLVVTPPDGTHIQKRITTQPNGAYTYDLTPGQIGRWQMKLTWSGDANYQPVQEIFDFMVVNQAGQVVIVLGHLLEKKNEPFFNELSQIVYQTFFESGFDSNQDIRFLSAVPTDLSETAATIETLKSTLTEWSDPSSNRPLYLYLLSGNQSGQILLTDNNNELVELSPSWLASWISPLKSTIVIVEANYSGRFIQPLLTISNGTIITSSQADQPSYTFPSFSFTSLFCQYLKQNQTIAQSFKYAVETIRHVPVPYKRQLPQLVSDGDNQPNEWTDFSQLGQQRISLSPQTIDPTLFFENSPNPVMIRSGETSNAIIPVQVSGQSADRVFATIFSPSSDIEAADDDHGRIDPFFTNQELVQVETNQGETNTYELIYSNFEKIGTYTILFHAESKNQSARPILTTVTVLDEIIPPSLPDIPKSKIDLVHPQMAYLGQNLTVEVVIETETSLAGWSFDVSYDPKILSFQAATIRDFLGVDIDKIYFEPGILDDELGLIRRLLATRLFPGGSKGTGQLVELSFKTIGIGTSELELKNAQLGAPNGQILAPQISSSIITIIGVLPGDANRDGQVDILDLVTVGRHFSQEGDKLPGDVNADGQVNILDLVMVAKYYGEGEGATAAPSLILDHDQNLLLIHLLEQLESWTDTDKNIQIVISLLKRSTRLNQIHSTRILLNYPNPFNPETWIPFTISPENNGQDGTITIHDSSGRLIRSLDLGPLASGAYLSPNQSAYWDGRTNRGELVPSGVYFCTLAVGSCEEVTTKSPMVIIK